MIGQEADKAFAYILGVYLGDGCVTTNFGKPLFRLNTIDKDFAKAVRTSLQKISSVYVALSVHTVSKSSKPNWSLALRDPNLCKQLQQATDSKAKIPDQAFAWPRNLKLAFIAGLMDSEGFVAANSNITGRRFYMGYKSCDPWVPDFIRLLQSVGIEVGKIAQERPVKLGYKVPTRFTIKMQSWIDSGARFNIARKQRRVDEWAATVPDPRGLRFRAKAISETICTAPHQG